MKLSLVVAGISLTSFVSANQWYPRNRKEEIPVEFTPYDLGQLVQMDCITRNIDNGEHVFDENDKIVYGPFPTCKETNRPLSFEYGVNADFNCTIEFTDNLYHLFQLYIHEDVPFGCRLPVSADANYLQKGGAYVPLTFNFRGEIHDSHLDIDSSLNVLLTKPANRNHEENTFISAVAYSSGTNVTRIVIGDSLTLNFAVRWLDQIVPVNSIAGKTENLPYADGFYRFPAAFVPISYQWFTFYLVLTAVLSGLVVFTLSYTAISRRVKNLGKFNLDSENKLD
ncbi:hypothetical protein G9P44_000019 [Scheffersomyces stipitis]|nr:hypothetical protein G9P44_000019 [Scheffersomyces stipitis]